MKHIKDAKKILEDGNAADALEIIENILDLAPKNTEAIRLKAYIYDSWGRFDESFALLRQLYQNSDESDDILSDYERRVQEDRDAMNFSRLTVDGRWYFPFSGKQVIISLLGLIGCVVFLITAPSLLKENNGIAYLFLFFVTFVLIPWCTLIVTNLHSINKILVGFQGISIFYGFKRNYLAWDSIAFAVIEYSPNIKDNYLHLIFYESKTRKALLNLDISSRSGVVKARRHFVRLLLSYVPIISYVPRGKATDLPLTTQQKGAA